MRCVLLRTLEAVECVLDLREDVGGTGGDTLCAALYTGRWALFARGVEGVGDDEGAGGVGDDDDDDGAGGDALCATLYATLYAVEGELSFGLSTFPLSQFSRYSAPSTKKMWKGVLCWSWFRIGLWGGFIRQEPKTTVFRGARRG